MKAFARPPLELYHTVNREIAAPDVAEFVGLTKARERHKWNCPVHGGSDSLHAYPGQGKGFTCFVCEARAGKSWRGYSNVDIAVHALGIEPADAVLRLADRFHVSARDDSGKEYAPRRREGTVLRTTPPAAQEHARACFAAIDALRAAGTQIVEPAAIYEDIAATAPVLVAVADVAALADGLRTKYRQAELELAGLEPLPNIDLPSLAITICDPNGGIAGLSFIKVGDLP